MKIIYPFYSSWLDYPSNDISLVVTFLGCEHNCYHCQNKDFQDYNYKSINDNLVLEVSEQELYFALLKESKRYRTTSIVLEGGDPLFINNRIGVSKLLDINKELNFCIYTGYSIEEIKSFNIKGATYYKCGKYIENLKDTNSGKTDIELVFASKNQRLYDSNFELVSIDNHYKF